jgi:transaldolase
VNTLPEATIAAFEDHGTVRRTIDTGVDEAEAVMGALREIGVDMGDVGQTLEDEGIAGFQQSFTHVLDALAAKCNAPPLRHPTVA